MGGEVPKWAQKKRRAELNIFLLHKERRQAPRLGAIGEKGAKMKLICLAIVVNPRFLRALLRGARSRPRAQIGLK